MSTSYEIREAFPNRAGKAFHALYRRVSERFKQATVERHWDRLTAIQWKRLRREMLANAPRGIAENRRCYLVRKLATKRYEIISVHADLIAGSDAAMDFFKVTGDCSLFVREGRDSHRQSILDIVAMMRESVAA